MTIYLPYWTLPFLAYFGFVGSITIYRRYMAGDMHPITLTALAPFIIAFFTLDVVANYTVLVLAMGLPPSHCYTISERFAYYDKSDAGWRGEFARWFCNTFLNVFDKGHC